jgi:hypothetical protein
MPRSFGEPCASRCKSQSCAGTGCAGLPFFWKHARHSTGLPCVGLKGTVVSVPHSEHVVRVSGLTRIDPRARLALHCLQCFGSFLNCLSWKKICSPAVNTKSDPQSTHLSTRSTNSMAGIPHRDSHRNRPSPPMTRRFRFPVLFEVQIKGPDRTKLERYTNLPGPARQSCMLHAVA